ncbi:MAG: tRNA preQ1(34) S-adenosylmethionine ribosyltransferase-isomerase QueA [Phycisphaerales bacterium]|nr:MAG: tRNA preQ1(34) S-adenosylmethionine ribosyltransferase-isomerase QueA [Phycisphaerales bacterium]
MCTFGVTDLEYDLPGHLIAQHPTQQRGSSRLLVIERARDRLSDRRFSDLPSLLHAGDTLVLNDTRVVPAKIVAWRRSGGRIDGLFLQETTVGQWEVMLRGRGRLRAGETLALGPSAAGEPPAMFELTERLGGGRWRVCVQPVEPAESLLERVGLTPLPPYIRRGSPSDEREPVDRRRYQTVYARRAGAVAAPTAGLHFTEAMLKTIESADIAIVQTTLHVGPGTFTPIKAKRLDDHRMHAEWYVLPHEVAVTLNERRRGGGRIVAVGTSSVRLLESCAEDNGDLRAGNGWTDLFCYPPFRFKATDVLLTNFHLPRSTLLALVMAFAGVEATRRAYQHAIHEGYRFYSYGDAMLIV